MKQVQPKTRRRMMMRMKMKAQMKTLTLTNKNQMLQRNTIVTQHQLTRMMILMLQKVQRKRRRKSPGKQSQFQKSPDKREKRKSPLVAKPGKRRRIRMHPRNQCQHSCFG
uniref:Uncharacterized protein n=2 Tax=Cacopsylla melanoneura TaxID=428564 RepID=A0A8D8SQF6_9HEMI